MFFISGRRDSNSRQSAWKADALPTELLPHVLFNCFAGFFSVGRAFFELPFRRWLHWATELLPHVLFNCFAEFFSVGRAFFELPFRRWLHWGN